MNWEEEKNIKDALIEKDMRCPACDELIIVHKWAGRQDCDCEKDDN